MIVIRIFTIFIVIICSTIQASQAGKDKFTYYRDFWNPLYHGKILNYCNFSKEECGKSVADKYCRFMGYESSSKIITAYNVGVTNYLDKCLGSPGCTGWNCNGFRLIRCISKIKHSPVQSYYFRTQTFVLPRMDNYRIAWCYKDSIGCGARVAFSFCRRMGFMKALNYEIDKDVHATKALGNHKLCFGNTCQAFNSITCYR